MSLFSSDMSSCAPLFALSGLTLRIVPLVHGGRVVVVVLVVVGAAVVVVAPKTVVVVPAGIVVVVVVVLVVVVVVDVVVVVATVVGVSRSGSSSSGLFEMPRTSVMLQPARTSKMAPPASLTASSTRLTSTSRSPSGGGHFDDSTSTPVIPSEVGVPPFTHAMRRTVKPVSFST